MTLTQQIANNIGLLWNKGMSGVNLTNHNSHGIQFEVRTPPWVQNKSNKCPKEFHAQPSEPQCQNTRAQRNAVSRPHVTNKCQGSKGPGHQGSQSQPQALDLSGRPRNFRTSKPQPSSNPPRHYCRDQGIHRRGERNEKTDGGGSSQPCMARASIAP